MHGIRVDERNLQPEEPGSWLRVDQVSACISQLGQRRVEVGDLVGDVVHSRPAFGEEATDGRVLAERLQQLHSPVADAKRSCAHSLILNRGGPVLDLRSEQPRVRLQRDVEILDGHSKVMDPARVHWTDAIGRPSGPS